MRINKDYYPGGSQMPGRSYQSGDYRYGFNGYEKDNEVKGEGNHLSFGGYGYDTRIIRRWNVDPVVKDNQSPYVAFANNPIWYADKEGLDTLKMHLQMVETQSKNLVVFKVTFELIQNGVSKSVEAPMNLSGSSEIYIAMPRRNYVNKNRLDNQLVYNIQFKKGGTFQELYSAEWNENTILVQDYGRGQFIHPANQYEASAGCLIPGVLPSSETIQEFPADEVNMTLAYSVTKTSKNGGDAVSKSMLKAMRILYNSSKENNSTAGELGFQLTTKPMPMKKMPTREVESIDL